MVAPSPTAPPDPLQMNDADLSRLANELARDIYPLEEILRQYQIDPIFFRDYIMQHPRFRQFYVEAHAVWNAASNAQQRSALKAAVMFEEWLVESNRLYHDTNQPLSSKVELMKLLARVSGLDANDRKAAGVNPGERVVININLGAGGQRDPLVIDKVAPVTLDVLPEKVI